MTQAIYRNPIIFLILFLSSCYSVSAQDFYQDYRKHLIGNGRNLKKRIPLIDNSIKRLRMTINRFQSDNNKSFFLVDTIFMVGFQGAETGDISKIIWTKHACCYYQYSYDLANWKKVNERFIINTNAVNILKSFNQEFRYAVEKIDTVAYTKYTDSHKVYDGEWVTPVIAVKKDDHWRFVNLKGNGWAIDYTFRKKDMPSNIDTVINNLSKQHLGFDIDSANTAYCNDTSKIRKQPSYPVFILNGKVINYNQVKLIKLYNIKAISVWRKNSNNPAIPNGINNEFGIIEITTNEKTN